MLLNPLGGQWIMISTLFEPVCYGPKRMPLKCTCNPIQDTLHATYEVDHCVCQHSMLKGFCFFVLKSSFYPDSFLKTQFFNYIAPHVYKCTYTPNTNTFFSWFLGSWHIIANRTHLELSQKCTFK